jgi:hypothetical protein
MNLAALEHNLALYDKNKSLTNELINLLKKEEHLDVE